MKMWIDKFTKRNSFGIIHKKIATQPFLQHNTFFDETYYNP
jgi:hypothetical protein